MKLSNRVLVILSLTLIISCTQYLEIPFPSLDSTPIGDELVTIQLNYKQEVVIDNKLKIRFEGVGADSRCPIDAICVWAGDAEVFFNISTENSTKPYTLHSGLEPQQIVIENYFIQLINLLPATRSDRKIKPEEYKIEIRVTKLLKKSPYAVLLINANQQGMIKKDILNITEVSLENDILDFTVGYSGGCREHLIELFALKEIAKSNPAQVTINLSHFSNGDMCDAYITKKIQFDLTPLKQFLKNHYGINDRVILVVFDPSGKPINNAKIDYKL